MAELDDLKKTLILFKLEFENALLGGKPFEEAKKIHVEIRELERAIAKLEPQLRFHL